MKWLDARKTEDWMPMTECVHGALYRIASRNLLLGVYTNEQQGFVGFRTKFSDKFLFVEHHWDNGEPCGTAKPLELIEMYPYDDVNEGQWIEGIWVKNSALMVWLDQRLNYE